MFLFKRSDKYWINKSRERGLSEEFIEKHSDKLDWKIISAFQKLSEGFIERHSDKVDWWNISINQKLSEPLIEKYSDKVRWLYISKHQKLSEEFIERHSDKVNWGNISEYQKLSEKFIKKHSDKVVWTDIFKYQKLSEWFIEGVINKIDWKIVSKYQRLSPSFFVKYNLEIPESSWMYSDKEWKRKKILATGLYEIIGDKVIAYKSCRSDGYSTFNFQYHYEVGEEYEAHANYNEDECNSFGLSAWAKLQALDHYSVGKLFKVEIDLEDIACIVYEGKIRASKIKILKEIKPYILAKIVNWTKENL